MEATQSLKYPYQNWLGPKHKKIIFNTLAVEAPEKWEMWPNAIIGTSKDSRTWYP